VGLGPGQERLIRVDGAPLARGVDPPRPLVSVFLPDRLDLVKGAPAGRRAHLDRVVAALWPARAANRAAYARALSQRNALIARVRAGGARAELLDTWDAELARHGAALMSDRVAAAELVAPIFTARAAELGLPEPAELHSARRERLAALVRADGQAVLTTTDAAHVPGASAADVALLEVTAGTVVQHAPGVAA